MNPGPATSTEVIGGSDSSFGLIASARARGFVSRGLRQHHRRIRRQIAMRGIARRLDRHILAVEVRRQNAIVNKVVEHSLEERGILGVEAQFASPVLESGASSAASFARHPSLPLVALVAAARFPGIALFGRDVRRDTFAAPRLGLLARDKAGLTDRASENLHRLID